MHWIIVTGFEPFGGESVNPSWQLAKQLDGWQPNEECTVKAIELPCVFDESIDRLNHALAQYQPCLVLALGQAGGRSAFSLEKVAINYNDARIADNAGQQPIDTATISDGPTAYFSTLPLKAIVHALHQQHIPAEISYSAGTYVCNHLFYGLMHALKDQPKVRAGFIHIPLSPQQACQHKAPSMSIEMGVEAVKTTIDIALTQHEDMLISLGNLN
ncbi:pyroglutamyl-peptidase I [Vibrio mimicus]